MRPLLALRGRFLVFAVTLGLGFGCTSSHDPVGPQGGGSSGGSLLGVGVPQSVPSGDRANYTTPAHLLASFEHAIENPSTWGTKYYLESLSNPGSGIGERPFRAIHDPAVRANWQAAVQMLAPEPWDITRERDVPGRLTAIRPTSRYDLRWSPDLTTIPRGIVGTDTMDVHLEYRLVATHADAGTPADIIAIGSCELSLERSRGRCAIYRWIDHVDPATGVVPVIPDERTFTWWRLESLVRY